jgi:hypothetical protein
MQLVSDYMSEASGENLGEEFVLSYYEGNWAIIVKRAWTGGFWETNEDSMFLSPGYVFG